MNEQKPRLREPTAPIQLGETLAGIHAWAQLPARELGKAFQGK